MIIEKASNSDGFIQTIEDIKSEYDLSYMDSIIYYCEKMEIEIESVSKMISKSIKANLYREALSLNMLKEKRRVLL